MRRNILAALLSLLLWGLSHPHMPRDVPGEAVPAAVVFDR